jgi:hypothetical protein
MIAKEDGLITIYSLYGRGSSSPYAQRLNSFYSGYGTQKPNSGTYNFVEVSGYNFESSQT